MTQADPLTNLQSIIKAAEVELVQNSPKGFSPEGFERLKRRIGEFIGQLTIESMRVAKRHQSDSISPAHVDRASEYLVSGKSNRWQKLVEGLGLATAASMILEAKFSTRGVIISVVCILVGMPAFMFHLMKD